MSGDPTDRIAELAELIEKRLDEDEDLAQDLLRAHGGPWSVGLPSEVLDSTGNVVVADEYRWSPMRHIARNDPARALRRVKATRNLVAEILAERHQYVEDCWYSCSQATEPGEDDAEPGSACCDDTRAGKPCDCGRDARVARMLGIIASEWEEIP